LEHGNDRSEPERERDSLGHIVQFPIRRRSTATSSQRNGRFLQDRFADDGCNPGACWGGVPNSNANTNCDCNLNIYTNGNCDSNCDSYTHPNTDFDSAAYPDPKVHSTAPVSTYSAAPPVAASGESYQVQRVVFNALLRNHRLRRNPSHFHDFCQVRTKFYKIFFASAVSA
jgi:hypothetical protein